MKRKLKMPNAIPALGRNCFECRYADQIKPPAGQAPMVICRRFPPTSVMVPNGSMATIHPVVGNGDWCFEYSAALKLAP